MNLYWPLVTPRPVNICVNYVSVKFSRMFISSCGIIFYFFSLYLYPFVRPYGMVGAGVWFLPTLVDVVFFFAPPLMVQECSPLVVLDPFISVPPLEVNQVYSGGLEIWFPAVLGIPNEFPQFVQMVPHDLDVVVYLLNMKNPARRDNLKT